MPLKFNGAWRFTPPADGEFINRTIPESMVSECIDLIGRVATQGDAQDVLEHFKGYFCKTYGAPHSWSSSASWALTDLWQCARSAAENAPLFIEAFHDACESFRSDGEEVFAPDADMINAMLAKHRLGYEVRPPRLLARENISHIIKVEERPASLAEQAFETLQSSLARSEQLLSQGHGREAVQESLWLLESVTTAFRGVDSGTGTVSGKYFNQIVKDLRAMNRGSSLEHILGWITALHGFMSSPTGGGVRHGLDLRAGVSISDNEARLFCNLIRSYLAFLLGEHQRMVNGK